MQISTNKGDAIEEAHNEVKGLNCPHLQQE